VWIDGQPNGQIWITVIATGLGGARRLRSLAGVTAHSDPLETPSFLTD
jgi:hypothetical protein